MSNKPSWRRNPDGTFTRTDPDGSTHIVKGTDPQRIAGMIKLIFGLVVFVVGLVVIVVVASHVGNHEP